MVTNLPTTTKTPDDTPRWKKIWHAPEGKTLAIAIFCGLLIFSWYFLLCHNNPAKAGSMRDVICKHIIGGAAIGALTGAPNLAQGIANRTIPMEFTEMPSLQPTQPGMLPGAPLATEFSNLENILLNSLISVTLICLVYGFFSLSTKKLLGFKNKLLTKTFSEMEQAASTKKSKWKRWGIPGVFIFVWIPLTGTGPIVGAILGRIIGLSYWTNLITVGLGSISSITAWAIFAKFINQWLGGRWIDIISDIFIGAVLCSIIAAKGTAFLRKKFGKCKKTEETDTKKTSDSQ